MATTTIGKITTSPSGVINYVLADKIEKGLKDKEIENIYNGIAYKLKKESGEVVFFTLSSFLNCSKETAKDVFNKYANEGRGKYRRNSLTKDGKEIVAFHLVQSFDVGEKIPPKVCNEIGQLLAKEVFGGHPCIISTHTNTDNIHNHIVFCAWNREGRKWHDNDKTKRLIRKVSDRLCEEYGLNINLQTQDMKMISYLDKNGNKRRFEPTDRKIKLAKYREAGGNLLGDVNDFRNTPAYENLYKKDKTNRATIKNDIDNLLSFVRSYDELIERLCDIGYEVCSKKKNGEWLKHTSFKAPFQDKPTRDYKISDDNFYMRENLTKYIDNRSMGIENIEVYKEDDKQELIAALSYYDNYDYINIDVANINEDFRISKSKDANFIVVKRTEPEKNIIEFIKKCDVEVKGIIDTSGLHRIIKEQEAAKKEKRRYMPSKKEELLIYQIKESFENLRFIEKKGLYSYEQINSLYKSVYEKYNANLVNIQKAERLIDDFNIALAIPQEAAELQSRIEENKFDSRYLIEDYNNDNKKLNQYKEIMKCYMIDTPDGEQLLRNKVTDSQNKINDMKKSLVIFAADIRAYERCIKVLDKIDRINNKRNVEEIKIFERTKNFGVKEARETKQGRRSDKNDR